MAGPLAAKVGMEAAKRIPKPVKVGALGLVGCLVFLPTLGVAMGLAVITSILSAGTVVAAGNACGTTTTSIPAFAAAGAAYQAGFRGNDLTTAVAIAGAESNWDPNVPDNNNVIGVPPATIDRGEWQLSSTFFYGPTPVFGGTGSGLLVNWATAGNVVVNVTDAFTIYTKAGNKFTGWDTFTNQNYQLPMYLYPAQVAVAILASVQAGKNPNTNCPAAPTYATACGSNPSAVPAFNSAQLAYAAGFRTTALTNAVAIAGAQSSWNPSAPDNTNADGTIDRGEWQIDSIYANGPSPVFGGPAPPPLADWTQLPDAWYNADTAYYLFTHNGNSFAPWDDQYVAGTYTQKGYMDPATLEVKILTAVLAGKQATDACPPPPGNGAPLNCTSRSYAQGWGDIAYYVEPPIAWWATQPPISYYNIYGVSRWHQGIDISCRSGPHPAPVFAIADGYVSIAGPFCGQSLVAINHGSYTSKYFHMRALNVSVWQTVKQGDLIGYLDAIGSPCSTGEHLHFQINSGYGQPGVSSAKGDDPCNYLPAGWIPAAMMNLQPYPCWAPTGYQAGLFYYY